MRKQNTNTISHKERAHIFYRFEQAPFEHALLCNWPQEINSFGNLFVSVLSVRDMVRYGS